MNYRDTLQICIECTKATQECILLRRQMQQVKQKREQARRKFETVCYEYKTRMSKVLHRFHELMYQDVMLPSYITKIASQYSVPPPRYVLEHHVDLFRYLRHQELLDSYLKLNLHQNLDLIEEIKRSKKNLIIGLMINEEKLLSIQRELLSEGKKKPFQKGRMKFYKENYEKNTLTLKLDVPWRSQIQIPSALTL